MIDVLRRLARRATAGDRSPDRSDTAASPIAPRLGGRFERARPSPGDATPDQSFPGEIEHVRPAARAVSRPSHPPAVEPPSPATERDNSPFPPVEAAIVRRATEASGRPEHLWSLAGGFEPVVAARVLAGRRPEDRGAPPAAPQRTAHPAAPRPSAVGRQPAVAPARPIAPVAPPPRPGTDRRRPVTVGGRIDRRRAGTPTRIEWAGCEPLGRLGMEPVRDAEVLAHGDVADAASGAGTTVHVHVDRLEVQRPGPPAPPPPAPPRPSGETLGLAQYLEQRRAGREGRR